MGDNLIVEVECYSGSAYGERPRAIIFEKTRLQVNKILSEQRSPEGKQFKVLLEDEREVVLKYDVNKDLWQVDGLV